MKPGTLIRAVWGGTRTRIRPGAALGEVIRYEPDCHGGSQMYTSRWDGNVECTIDHTPKRGRVLVLLYEDGSLGWWDENSIEPLGDDDGM